VSLPDIATRLVARDRTRQGLPERIADPETLRRVAALIRAASTEKKSSPTSGQLAEDEMEAARAGRPTQAA